MNGKARLVKYLIGVLIPLLAIVVLLTGCQKDKPVVGTQTVATTAKEAAPAPAQAAQTPEQTTCPVMGGPINKSIFIEYQGKKVYFCCNGCPDMFKANPEKYISKLPQFAK